HRGALEIAGDALVGSTSPPTCALRPTVKTVILQLYEKEENDLNETSDEPTGDRVSVFLQGHADEINEADFSILLQPFIALWNRRNIYWIANRNQSWRPQIFKLAGEVRRRAG